MRCALRLSTPAIFLLSTMPYLSLDPLAMSGMRRHARDCRLASRQSCRSATRQPTVRDPCPAPVRLFVVTYYGVMRNGRLIWPQVSPAMIRCLLVLATLFTLARNAYPL